MEVRHMTDMEKMDRKAYLTKMQERIRNSKIINLIKEDLDLGLSIYAIDDYVNRGLNIEQMTLVSQMYRKEFSAPVVSIIGDAGVPAEKMKIAMDLYEMEVPIEEIKKGLEATKTAHDMRKAFASVLEKVQAALAIAPDKVAEDIKKDDTIPAYVTELMEQLKDVVDRINHQDERYDAFNKKLSEYEVAKQDEAITRNLTKRNEELEKKAHDYEEQIAELSKELGGKQDEIARGLQTVSQLRNEVENGKEEMKKMQEEINRLTEKNAALEETVHEQGQAIIAKDTVIAKTQTESDSTEVTDKKDKPVVKTEEAKSDVDVTKKSAVASTQPHTIPSDVVRVPVTDGIPVYYTMTIMQDSKLIHRDDIEYMHRKPSVFNSIMSRFASKKKSHRTLMELVINKDLTPEQVNEIKVGLEKGLNEEQLELIINKNLSAERIRSIVGFAALQNSLEAGRREA